MAHRPVAESLRLDDGVALEFGCRSADCSEQLLARHLCAALNTVLLLRQSLDSLAADVVGAAAELDNVTVKLFVRLPQKQAVPSGRDVRDDIRRAVDRASGRVFPGVDSRCFAHPSALTPAGAASDSEVELLRVSAVSPAPNRFLYSVQGVAYYDSARLAADKGVIRTTLPKVPGRDASRCALQRCHCDWLADVEHHRDVLSYSRSVLNRPCTHVEPKGMALSVAVVASGPFSSCVAVACSKRVTRSGWLVVGRVPVVLDLGVGVSSVNKRPRTHSALAAASFGPHAVHYQAVDEGLTFLPEERYVRVDIVAFRVSCVTTGGPASSTATVEFDDVYVTSSASPIQAPSLQADAALDGAACSTLDDVFEIIKRSCSAAVDECNRLEGRIATIVRAMIDTKDATFKGDRRGSRLTEKALLSSYPLSPYLPGASIQRDTQLSVEETALIECKASTAAWNEAEKQEGAAVRPHLVGERLRHTLCALANTFGGFLVIGVHDSGAVLGVPVDQEAHLRFTGFCPAMATGAIDIVKHAVSSGTATLPVDWWKAASSRPAAGGSAPQPAAKKLVVLVYKVRPTAAPYHSPSRNTWPSQRGLASTLRMPVTVCCERLRAHLAGCGTLNVDALPVADLGAN